MYNIPFDQHGDNCVFEKYKYDEKMLQEIISGSFSLPLDSHCIPNLNNNFLKEGIGNFSNCLEKDEKSVFLLAINGIYSFSIASIPSIEPVLLSKFGEDNCSSRSIALSFSMLRGKGIIVSSLSGGFVHLTDVAKKKTIAMTKVEQKKFPRDFLVKDCAMGLNQVDSNDYILVVVESIPNSKSFGEKIFPLRILKLDLTGTFVESFSFPLERFDLIRFLPGSDLLVAVKNCKENKETSEPFKGNLQGKVEINVETRKNLITSYRQKTGENNNSAKDFGDLIWGSESLQNEKNDAVIKCFRLIGKDLLFLIEKRFVTQKFLFDFRGTVENTEKLLFAFSKCGDAILCGLEHLKVSETKEKVVLFNIETLPAISHIYLSKENPKFSTILFGTESRKLSCLISEQKNYLYSYNVFGEEMKILPQAAIPFKGEIFGLLETDKYVCLLESKSIVFLPKDKL